MTEAETRLACLELAVTVTGPREPTEARVDQFTAFVSGDAVRLGCLRLACKTHGHVARLSAERLVEMAVGYEKIVTPPKKTAARGGRKT